PVSATLAAYTLTTEDGLALDLSGDGQVMDLRVDGESLVDAAGPALLLRDLSYAGQATTPNLLDNPSFEQGLSGWQQMRSAGIAVTLTGEPVHDGGQAVQFARSSPDAAFTALRSDPIPVQPGARYRVAGWWRSQRGYVTDPAGVPPAWQDRFWKQPPRANGLYIQWLDAGRQPLGDAQLAVPLHWNAAAWRLTRRELTAPAEAHYAQVIAGVKLAGDILWLDDLSFVHAAEEETPLGGTVTPCSQARKYRVRLRTSAKHLSSTIRRPSSSSLSNQPGAVLSCFQQTISQDGDLSVIVTYTSYEDHIAIHGEIMGHTGQDRALDISWGLPLAASGGTWWDDVHASRTIDADHDYANSISAIYDGWLPISLYPYAGISRGAAGVSLAAPGDRPQLVLFQFQGSAPRFEALFHLGISPQASKLKGQATFDLLLYRFDVTGGLRDVMARHRTMQANVHTSTLSLYGYADRVLGSYISKGPAQNALAEDAANIYSAQYTIGELHLGVAPDTGPMPTVAQAEEAVTTALQSGNDRDAAFAQAILNSAAVDPNGDWSIKKVGAFPWSDGQWEAVWAANMDPDLAGGLAAYMVNWSVDPAFNQTMALGAHLDGVQIDNFLATPTFDLRPEALAAADHTLGYSPHTYQPGVHTGFAFYEYLDFLRRHLDEKWGRDRGITVNFWGLGHPNYLAGFLDGFGSEGSLQGDGEGDNWTPALLDYRRAIAGTAPYMFANQTPGLTAAEAYTFSQMALLYGVFPSRGPNATGWEAAAGQIISDTRNLVSRYWAAGWAPRTHARADSPDVWIERFGAAPASGRPL
ncbi:MAG: hypothetical protein D6790_10915, partial [Caldilineae bacterium]